MEPMNREPEEYGHEQAGDASGGPARPQRPRDPLTPDFGQQAPALARTVQLVSGDFLLTVNPVDGSEIEPCPPGERPDRPAKRAAGDRAELRRAALPPVPPGPALPGLPLLERQEERERLVRLLARGRSVRLTGPAGSGRTALLNAVAEDCADLAPDGVVRLSGYRRTPGELLQDLFTAVYDAPLHRPDTALLLELVNDIGAVVVLDDLEFGGAGLDEVLDATPECAFLISTTPDVAAPSPDSHLEEVFLGGLGRGGSLELLERVVGRVLDDEEANWAGDLWFESEGLPLRFVQAGALLRQRDQLRADPHAFEENGFFADTPVDAPFDADEAADVPLPSLADGAAPAALLASRLSPSARAALEFAVALGGELPHQTHLPALVGDTHADAALAELVGCALVTAVGARYRLAAGVRTQLESAGYADDSTERARAAAQHYAWWAGHPSVAPERVAAEADAVLAALAALVTVESGAAVLLARTAAPAFAGGLAWGAWERALRSGQEAARNAGEVAEEAYFHHELGVLALCGGRLDRARAELEASIGLRGALADKRGMISGRRALALVADRSGGALPGGRTAAGEEVPGARHEESASPPGGVPAALAPPKPASEQPATLVSSRVTPVVVPAKAPTRRSILNGTRRNLVAAGAGALLVAVLGTVVTLGATSGGDGPGERVTTEQSATEDPGDDGLTADKPRQDSTSRPGGTGEDGVPGTADDPAPSTSGEPSDAPSTSGGPSDGPSDEPSDKPTSRPPTSRPPTSKPPTSRPPTSRPPTSKPPTSQPPTSQPPTSDAPPSSPDNSGSMSRPASSPETRSAADPTSGSTAH
ncbi:AAA family ATPase [Streptomyces alfalfae]|uniref:AAA family ATPase n=1 Tax=Streptomyces alfalfae TaxID=1642299 RepID=A0ABN4VFZ6_9ACTN|nr:AAA family ATPase [Streptomyces alfalfae]AYA16704.1 ATP-binding protein [Streptomyces fradiae]APY86323.1 AAA family ATPase [Streptomyces alfalfae]QUI33917.1 ATP-binding protein [Streptomyces alfalfae]RXX44402.1 AAA family ATPase [Streptomyces alfalfae]RZM87004.1 ATP-binding protein [Streptomyces alfalfae]